MDERLSRLESKYLKPVSLTPNRIDQYLHHKEETLTPGDVWMMMPPEIVMEFTSNTGRLKEKKVKKFMRSLENLMDDYEPHDLIKMSADCINKDGSVDKTKLQAILDEEE